MVQGPPGTGKTRTAAEVAWLLARLSYKVLYVAPASVVVDSATKTIYDARPADLSDMKVLRIESTHLSHAEILRHGEPDDIIDAIGADMRQTIQTQDRSGFEEYPLAKEWLKQLSNAPDPSVSVNVEYLNNVANFSKTNEYVLGFDRFDKASEA